jgi:predicted helicase
MLSRRQAAKFSSSFLRQCTYRPFDFRWLYYDARLVSRAGFDVMQHMAASNVALLLTRQVTGREFHHVFVSRHLVDRDPLSLITRERTQVFPLYLYPADDELDASAGRRPNINPEFLKTLAKKLKISQAGPHGLPQGVTPEDIVHYAYAIFHSPTYRTRYAEFLKIDFPRLPLTSDPGLFRSLCELGRGLVALHLLEKHPAPATRFPIVGDGEVETVRYAEPGQGSDSGRVWINKTQYFEGVPPDIWAFHVGGYQVCQKWLKDRKGRRLSYDDITHYQRIVATLGETIRLMAEIDRVIEAHGGWPLK